MTSDDIRKVAYNLIGKIQWNTSTDAKTDELRYLMAYNDGVIALCNKLISEIEKKDGEQNDT